MFTKEVLSHLSYSRCDCPLDVRESIGIVNGMCPKHDGSILLFDGIPINDYKKILEKRLANIPKKALS